MRQGSWRSWRAPRWDTPQSRYAYSKGDRDVDEVAAFWPAHRLVVQLDGFAYHRTRRDRERDAATDADLELVRHRIVRLTWDEVTVNPARTTRRMRLLLSDT